MSQPQTYANHRRTDPVFHFFIVPVLLANVIYRLVLLVRYSRAVTAWSFVVAVALLLVPMVARIYALRVQDRVIRMEERIRIAAVASPETLARIDELTESQYVALRFAPFAELAQLAQRALVEKLTAKQIKQAIVNWRPDTHRV